MRSRIKSNGCVTRASSFYPIGLITCPQASKCFVLQHFCCMRSASSLKIIGFRIILLHAKPLRLQNALFYNTFAACEVHQASKSSVLQYFFCMRSPPSFRTLRACRFRCNFYIISWQSFFTQVRSFRFPSPFPKNGPRCGRGVAGRPRVQCDISDKPCVTFSIVCRRILGAGPSEQHALSNPKHAPPRCSNHGTRTSDRTADGRFGPQASSGECDFWEAGKATSTVFLK